MAENDDKKGVLDTIQAKTDSSSPRSSHSAGSVSSDSGCNDTKPQEKICVVCGDTATGTHFAAMTCEGCKGFFRRSMKKCSQFTCAFENQCAINKSNRKHCQACRLQKCLAVGMNSNLIMSDESVNRKRELIRANREKRAILRMKKEQEEMEQRQKAKMETSLQPAIEMMPEDKALIKMMLDSHNSSYDFSYGDYETFRGRQHIAQPNSDEITTSHVTLAWLMAARNECEGTGSSGDKGKLKKSTGKSDKKTLPKKVKEERPSLSDEDRMYDTETSGSGDVLEMFSSLHGVSQPGFPISQCSAPSTSQQHDSSFYSDTSGSVASTSPNLPSKAQDFDLGAFGSGFPDVDGQEAMFNPFGGMDMAGVAFDSMSYLQGLFMNQDNTDMKTHSLFQHFCDIMTWGIKKCFAVNFPTAQLQQFEIKIMSEWKVIEFCKCIPEFQDLTTVDQINLLRGGCLEMLVLRSYFAFASDGNKYMSEKFQYSPTDFLQAGASAEFIEQYTKVHMRMRKMKLKVEEICLLIGLVLFSPDRPGIQDCAKVESMQKRIAQALRAYEYTNKDPEKACVVYSELLLLLPVLRTINVLFSNTILTLKSSNEDDMNPLILEVNN